MQETSPIQVDPEVQSVPMPDNQQPKTNNFLVILLAVLLIISVSISGFFAYQTQKLVKELQENKNMEEVVETTEPIVKPVATESSEADPTTNWKTYTDLKFNYSLKFPDTWSNQTGINDKNLGNFSFKSNEEEWITGTVFTGTPDLENDAKNDGSGHSFVLDKGKYLLIVYSECVGPGCDVSKNHLDTFNQILSTFKITN